MPEASLDEQGLPHGYPYKPEHEITPRELRDELAEADVSRRPVVVDVREQPELDVAPFVGALHIPLGELERRAEDLADEIEDRLGLDEGRGTGHPIAVLCHAGVRSMRGTLMLRALGFGDVRSVAGGIDLWSVDIDPGIARY